VDVIRAGEIALELRGTLQSLGLESVVKVSGSKGVQVYIPLNTKTTYEATQSFAHGLALWMEQNTPDRVIAKMTKAARTGKVFVDWSQNSDFKTTVSVYSLRAKTEQPTVSCPVSWEELEEAVRKRKPEQLVFLPDAVLDRVTKQGDLFAPMVTLKQKLPKAAISGLSA
jgi:bifunctional non-homologous end joining protein LigD